MHDINEYFLGVFAVGMEDLLITELHVTDCVCDITYCEGIRRKGSDFCLTCVNLEQALLVAHSC
jgi:hypothetical protein